MPTPLIRRDIESAVARHRLERHLHAYHDGRREMEIRHEVENRPSLAMTLGEARELAATDKTSWCITPLDYDLTVGMLVVARDLRIVKVCCEHGKVLRFPSIPSAREFLRNELMVSRTMLIPLQHGS
jgi:hypothetical protein